jgi:hypothetical protein
VNHDGLPLGRSEFGGIPFLVAATAINGIQRGTGEGVAFRRLLWCGWGGWGTRINNKNTQRVNRCTNHRKAYASQRPWFHWFEVIH